MKNILVPLDGSALAEQALPYARMIATIFGAKIHVLRVLTVDEKEALLSADPAVLYEAEAVFAPIATRESRIWDLLRQQAEGYLEGHSWPMRDAGLDVETHVQIGGAAATIITMAEHLQADVIVMVTHGYSGFKRWAVGSVTDSVVQSTNIPILVVPGSGTPAEQPRLQRIMLTLDGSEFAKHALASASKLATCANAELFLFRTVAPTMEVYQGMVLPKNLQSALQEQAHHELQTLASELRAQHISATASVVGGYAAEKIVEAATQHHVDLIVMATHGYTGIKRWARGSVADRVLHAVDTPLLLVHTAAHNRLN